MKILVIEDDLNKIRRIAELLHTHLPHAQIVERKSYQSGLKEALSSSPELIVLDMSMPTYDVSPTEKGGRTRPYAGREILNEIQRKRLVSSVIVVTQFESFGEGGDELTLAQLNRQLLKHFPNNYVTTVYYHPSESAWRENLIEAINGLLQK